MLPEPAELLEIADGETVELRIERGWFDQLFIHPERAPGGVAVNALRLYVVPKSKPFEPWYWDVTSGRLMSMLRPYMSRADLKELTFVVQAHGVAPSKYFTLEVK